MNQLHSRWARPLSVLGVISVICAPAQSAAQGLPVGSALEDYARLQQLVGRLPLSPVTGREGIGTRFPARLALRDTSQASGWDARLVAVTEQREFPFALLPVEARLFANTDRPWGVNDGAVWQGRGITFALSGGVRGTYGPLTLILQPLITRSANRAFELSPLAGAPGYSRYAYPTLRGVGSFQIDAPQRFGPDPFTVLDWGQTSLRADLGGLAVGFSNENLWWGPGVRNAITMTNNAPGFWHAHLGTSRPASIGIGTVSARWIWGSLRESAWFDTIPSNDRRFLTGAVVSFTPKWAPGLELGGSRTFQQDWRDGGPSAADVLLLVKPLQKDKQATPGNPTGEDEQDQIASLFARWALPESGLELYAEWGKGDHSSSFRDLLLQPEHGSGWLLGFQKAIESEGGNLWRVASELILLGAPRSTSTRSGGAGFFYVHGLIPQGYTQRGQIMGAGIGPGSSQLMMRVDRFSPWGSAGLSILRTVYDNDRFYRQPAPQDRRAHEVEPTFAGEVLVIRGPWDFGASFAASRLLNTFYVPGNDRWNLNLSLTGRYHPRLRD